MSERSQSVGTPGWLDGCRRSFIQARLLLGGQHVKHLKAKKCKVAHVWAFQTVSWYQIADLDRPMIFHLWFQQFDHPVIFSRAQKPEPWLYPLTLGLNGIFVQLLGALSTLGKELRGRSRTRSASLSLLFGRYFCSLTFVVFQDGES